MKAAISSLSEVRKAEARTSGSVFAPWQLLTRSSSGAPAGGGSALFAECLPRGNMLARGLAPGGLAPLGARDGLQAHEAAGRVERPTPSARHSAGELHDVAAVVAQVVRNRAGQTNLTLGITQCGVERKNQAGALVEVTSDELHGLRGGLQKVHGLLCFQCLESGNECGCKVQVFPPPSRPLLATMDTTDPRLMVKGLGREVLLPGVAQRKVLALACLFDGSPRLLPLEAAWRHGPMTSEAGLLEFPALVELAFLDQAEELADALCSAAALSMSRVARGLFGGGGRRDVERRRVVVDGRETLPCRSTLAASETTC